MMIFYPMLTSTTVSKNIMLGICKTLEQYLLIYQSEDIMNRINKQLSTGSQKTTKKVLKVGKNFYLKESAIEQNFSLSDSLEKIQEAKTKNQDPDDDEDKPKKKIEEDKPKNVKVELPIKDAMSIAPTFMQVQIPGDPSPTMFGIKVVPYPVKADGDMARLLLDDRYAPLLVKLLRRFNRSITRMAWGAIQTVARKLHIPYLGAKPVSGKVVPDILHAATKHAKNIFVLVNQADIDRSDFLDDPKQIARLQKMGWRSFIIADDVNQVATYCMSTTPGFCYQVNYSYLLSALGKDKLQIYNDLEDLQKKASPFFRLKKPRRKIFEGMQMKNKKEVVTERELVLEDLKSFMSKISKNKIDNIFKSIQKKAKRKDNNGIKKELANIPKIPLDTIAKFSRKLSSNFDSSYKTSQTVLKNSTKLSDKLIKPLSLIIATKSTYKVSDHKKELRDNLTSAVKQIRSQSGSGIPMYKASASVVSLILTIIFSAAGWPAFSVLVIALLVMVWMT